MERQIYSGNLLPEIETHEEDHKKLEDLSFSQLVEFTSVALQRAYEKDFKRPLMYGSFRWIYHHGKLKSIEDHPRNRRYINSDSSKRSS